MQKLCMFRILLIILCVVATATLATLYPPDCMLWGTDFECEDAELYYNDFNAWRPSKRDGIVRLIKMLQEAGIRIDGVGMQGHWGLNYPKSEYIVSAIDAYASLGVKVMITELDVTTLPKADSTL